MEIVKTYFKSRIRLLCLLLIFSMMLTSCGKINDESEESSASSFTADELELSDETLERIDSAKDEGSPTIVISNVEADQGKSVIVTLNLVNNPGILGTSMTLSYDDSVLTLEKVQNGDVFGSQFSLEYSEDLSSGCSFLWTADDISEEEICDGTILALKFKIKKNSMGKTQIHIICDQDGTVDKSLNVVNLNVNDGYITIVQ